MTTNTPVADNTLIDFTLLPLEETAVALRSLGLQLVTMTLEGEKQPSLYPLLSPSLVELLLRAGDASPPLTDEMSRPQQRWQRWAVWRQLRTIISWLQRLPALSWLFQFIRRSPLVRRLSATWRPPDIQYNDLVEKAARNQISSPEWQREVNRRLREALYGRPAQSMPPLFWPLIGVIAWSDLEVQHQVGQRIYDCLRPHHLFFPSFGPAPQLSPKTFWALIALAQPVPADLIITAEQRSHYAIACHLQQIARDQALVAGWAGFWDQWLLWQARRHWPTAFDSQTEIGVSLAHLPLLAQLSGELLPTASGQGELQLNNLAAPDWQDAAPSWLLHQCQEWQFEQGVMTRV